jgi:Tfp pilus assembly protein PilO
MKDLLNKIKNLKDIKDIEKINLDKKSILIIILAALLIVYLDYAFLIKGQMRSLSVVAPKVAKIREDLSDLNKNLFAIQDLKNKQALSAASKVKKIISQEQVALLLQDISNIANNNSVKILQMKPTKETQGKQEKVMTLTLSPILVTLDLICSYHSLGKFINDLENAEIFMLVQNIKIIEREPDSLIQEVNLVLRTYVKK